MNQPILDFFKAKLGESDVADKDIIELGSRNINGSVRPDIMAKHPRTYIGVDIEPGQYVDVICNIENIFDKFKPESFDLVISCEMIEHVIDFRQAINVIKNLAKPGALIMISTRSYGFGYHGYPYDFWRYEIDDMKSIFSDCDILELVSDGAKGVIIKAIKTTRTQVNLTNYELYNIIYDKKMRCERALFERFIEATGSINTLSGYFDSYTHLAETGKNCGTDKFTHGYLPKYEFFLNKFKNEKINILELGVSHGCSIHMWAQYFERAEIFGCDISPQTFQYHDERIRINILDLSKPSSYPILTARKYRIILDDASHYHDHQLLAFFNLFPYVEKGGIYIIEDLQTSFPPDLANYIHGSNDNTTNVLLHLTGLVCGENRTPLSINSYHNILKSFSPEIACISFIAKSCIIVKK